MPLCISNWFVTSLLLSFPCALLWPCSPFLFFLFHISLPACGQNWAHEGTRRGPPLTFACAAQLWVKNQIYWRVKTVSDVLEKTIVKLLYSYWMILESPELICLHPLSLFLSLFVAPSLISELRAEKIEQKSITLVWREPSYPNSSRTEYEVKYYEKVKPYITSWSVPVIYISN